MYELVAVVYSVNIFDNASVVQHLRDHNRGVHTTKTILQAEEQILEHVEKELDISTRRLAAEVGVSQFVVHCTIKEQGSHPYHVQEVQALESADFPCCVIYCEWLLQ